jgi:hypothetical protein
MSGHSNWPQRRRGPPPSTHIGRPCQPHITASDLLHHGRYCAWLEKSETDGLTEAQAIAHLSRLQQSIGWIRAATLAAQQEPRPVECIQGWLRQAFEHGDRHEQMLVLTLSLQQELHHTLPMVTAQDEIVTAQDETVQRIAVALDTLRLETQKSGPHPLRWELEVRLLQGLVQAHLRVPDLDAAQRYGGQMVTLAQLSGSAVLCEAANHLQAHVLMCLGRFDQSATVKQAHLGAPELLQTGLARDRATQDLAIALVNLGRIAEAQRVLQARLVDHSHPAELEEWLGWVAALGGWIAGEATSRFSAPPLYHWQADVMTAFSAALRLPPTVRATAQQRQHYQHVLDTAAPQPQHLPSDEAFARWARARARLLLGDYGVAAQTLTNLPALEPEDLLMRSWLAALQLELALSPLEALPQPLEQTEAELRSVFALARRLTHADAHELARHLGHWHPHAAAYAGLMPDPVPECEGFRDTLLTCRAATTWRGQRVPPPLATYLTERSLNRPARLMLGGNAQYQLLKLTSESGAVWGPMVTPLSLILGLRRGGPAHHSAAIRLSSDFGALPLHLLTESGRLPDDVFQLLNLA